MEGYAIYSEPRNACEPVRNLAENGPETPIFAVVDRGKCKFVTKAKMVKRAGFKGLILLDRQSHTGFARITGDDFGQELREMPIVFLLRPEADRFRQKMRENAALRVFVQGECSFREWHLVHCDGV